MRAAYFQNCHQGDLRFVGKSPERLLSPRSGIGRH
jgi:hypothetical protein